MNKKNLLNILKKFIDWLTHYHLRFSKNKSESSPYNSLSPTDNAENIDYYIESLNWALLNRDKIKNIAISGPYGSGKSSVIQTFQRKNQNNDFRFLNISLATFKEINTDKPTPENEELLRLIELSILQQFFYHEKDNKIPDSRFKKIKSHSKWFLWLQTIGFISFLISFLFLVFPKFLAKFSLIDITPNYQNLVHSIAVVIIALGLLFFLFKVTRIIKSVVIKKLSVNNASIEIDDSISKSILNNHLDEILYFFEVTKYNTVIIEDIDRFEQTEVFTKLRELNLLINNSKKTKEDIVFIYAIRDDMFKDKERTKFFDFMIPIIPVINSSNSSEKLLKIIKENHYKISNDLVSDISLFIDDMRLLFNIMNEYHIYSNSLNSNLNQDKLLSMIVYKNMHPIDFTDLSNNKGSLYETLSKKHAFIEEKNKEIDVKISEIKINIENYENSVLNNISELRIVYIYKIIEKIKQTTPSHPFLNFWIDNKVVNLPRALESENFDSIINSNPLQYLYNTNQSYRQNYALNFSNIQNEVNPEFTYKERAEFLSNKSKIEKLKKEIEEFEETKNKNKKHKIKELITDGAIELNPQENKQSELINILLRNGYIDEDYLDYISIFYEGSLSKSDYQFLINVKTQKNSEFDFKLTKIENLVKKINQSEFEKEYILNYSLMDFLLSNNKQQIKRKHLFNLLKNETKESISFINGYIDYSSNIELFIKTICSKWKNIWHYIENDSDYSEKKKQKYFRLIIEHANTVDIKDIFDNYKHAISSNAEFLNISKNQTKLKEIIKILDIKFKDITDSSPKKLLEFIYSNNYYTINNKMLKNILMFYDVFNQKEFSEKNYTAIQQSKVNNLIEYVDENLDYYISTTYLSIEPNNIENQNFLIRLLNNVDISLSNKEKIITKTETKIEDVDEIKTLSVLNLLLNCYKMIANWNNIFSVYIENDSSIPEDLIHFINNIDNAIELSKEKIDSEFPDEKTAKSFILEIILEDSFNSDSYNHILKSIPFIYKNLSFEKLSLEKVELLIKNKILSVTKTNFSLLKDKFKALHIPLLETNSKKFIENIDSFELENSGILSVLKSKKFSIHQKIELIRNFETSIFTSDLLLLNQTGNLLVDNLELDINQEIIYSVIIKSELQDSERIKIFIVYNNLFKNNQIEIFIHTLNKTYFVITENGKRPLIEYNELNENFIKILVRKKYISKYDIEKKGIRISTFKNK